MKKMGILMLLLFVALTSPAMASVFDDANSDELARKAPAMLVRGASQAVTSPVDIVEHGFIGTREGRPVLGTLKGLGRGTMIGLDRLGRGTVDVVTFLIPRYHGIPSLHLHELKFLNF
jgi:hypothetical protein